VTYLLPAPATLPAFGPWMLAQAKGYYKAEGLDVKFVAARGGVDVAKQVGAGNAVIGGAIGDTPIIARAQGIPVKAVAVLGAGSLMQLVSHKEERIESPRELKGKTVTVLAYTDTTYYALLGMLSKVGLTKNDVNIQAAGPCWRVAAVCRQEGGGHGGRARLDGDGDGRWRAGRYLAGRCVLQEHGAGHLGLR
jgi:NitT/TauT family transport system substrate-binding protein